VSRTPPSDKTPELVRPSDEAPELTPEQAEGLRAALGEAERGEIVSLDEVADDLVAEFGALEQVRRRAG